MKSDAIAFGVAGVLFVLIAGWIIGPQHVSTRVAPAAAPSAAAAPAGGSESRAALLDEAQVNPLKTVAERDASNPKPRAELANLYFDAERYDDAIKWYGDALKLSPNDVNVSTDLGVCYYYTNQPDKALEQFAHSLKIDPKHAKTLLNLGIVKAFAKQDFDGHRRPGSGSFSWRPTALEPGCQRASTVSAPLIPAPAVAQKPDA
jgi:tetratricopeptide (TPR) repeat protein